MLLTDEKFYTQVLNTDIPELNEVAGLWRRGNVEGAESAFARFIKKTLRPEIYFKTPYYERENSWAYSRESDLDAANRICEGKLMSCGVMHDFGGTDKVDWESNPTYNGYVEWPFQLNRHHEFRCLGRVYRDTGDEKYAEAYANLVRSWIENTECPEDLTGYGTKTWRTIEVGIRMAKNWHYSIHAFLNSPSVDDHLWVLTFKSLWEHAYRVTKNPTQNNWLIMEMTGLIHIANIYTFFRESDAWREYGFSRMIEEHSKQIYDDGFQFELSSGYHWVCIMNYQFVVDNSLLYGIKVPEEFMAGIRKLYSMYPKLVRPDGKLPALNDGGNDAVMPLLNTALEYFPSDAELLAFRDGKGREEFVGKTVFMPYSGMSVMRTGFDENDIWAFFESAPFGKAHQHEDKLNFLLSAYGKNMLTDSGNFAYDTSKMRKYVLSTRAHNTGLVDGMGQNRRKTFVWHDEDIKAISNLRVEEREDATVCYGRYDEGYGSELLPAVHERRVYFYKNGIGAYRPFFVLHDSFECEGDVPHTYEVSFQLGREPLLIKERGGVINFGDGVTLSVVGTGAMVTTTASEEPFMGWRPNHKAGDNPHYPAPVLSFMKKGRSAELVTVIYPTDGEIPAILPEVTEEGFTVSIGDEIIKEIIQK